MGLFDPMIYRIAHQISEHNTYMPEPCRAIEVRFHLDTVKEIAERQAFSLLPKSIGSNPPVPVFYVEAPPSYSEPFQYSVTCLDVPDQEGHRCMEEPHAASPMTMKEVEND